jgi:RNA polymerase sigma factor (sigma-70 family)
MLSPLLSRAVDEARILTAAEAENLAPAARAGDGEAIQALVESVYGLIAKSALGWRETADFNHDDLFSEGVAIVADAARKYDPSRAAWTTYATDNVRKRMLRRTRRLSARVHVPEAVKDIPGVDSLDAETEGGEPVFEPSAPEESSDAHFFESGESVLAGLKLSPRNLDIVLRRFGFSPYNEPQILEEAGAAHGITRERARQIVEAALRKLRRRLQ